MPANTFDNIIQNKQKWKAVFTQIADTLQNDSLFLLHFLQNLNLYHFIRHGKKDDSMLVVMLAVFPLFPQLQSVALRMMLRKKRWDVLSQACLSHVWEDDRRRLLEASVLQKQWSVVRQWSDHTVLDDERHWLMTETLAEALKHRAAKEIFKNSFRDKITKRVLKEAFKVAFKKAFDGDSFQQTFKMVLKRKIFSLSSEAYNERVFLDSFKDDFTEAFQVAFSKETFKRVFKDTALNEKLYKETVVREDFKEDAFQQAFTEAVLVFKDKTLAKTIYKDIAVRVDFKDVLRKAFRQAFIDFQHKDLKKKIYKEMAEREDFTEEALQEAFGETFRIIRDKMFTKKMYTDIADKVDFKDTLQEAFRKAFSAFRDKVLNEKIYKEAVVREDIKDALQEAFKEAFKSLEFKDTFRRKIIFETFREKALKDTFKNEVFKEAFKEEAFKYAFKDMEFEWKILQEVFPTIFPEWSFMKAFKEAFVSLREELFVSYRDPFLNAYREKAIGSLLQAFRECFSDEDFTDNYPQKWMSYLLLADHGLTLRHHMHAMYMIGKYSDWNIVEQMVERGGDLTEVHNLLGNWIAGNLRKKPQGDVSFYEQRYDKLVRTRRIFATNSHLKPRLALERCKWGSVMFKILHQPTQDYFSLVIDKVIEEEEWHILMHLVRLGMRSADRNRLFPEMVRQQRWGVCRMLLEQVVDEQLCVEALPELMDRNQWILVARVMEYNVDDAMRRHVMQCAFHRRAGVAFWHCLNVMEDKQPLTKEARVKLFHQAISRGIWQAVKPLVGEDSPEIQRRDMAFMEAIEQHVWHAVDYFQFNNINADINMKDENGETPLHREARKGEWLAVKEIVFRDADPNLLDKDGVSVLNRLIHHRQWNIVKFVIMYGGDIHLPARYSEDEDERHSPLQALITARQADVIKMSFMWCGDQRMGVNHRGENCLHAICDSDYRWDAMEEMMLRRVDPLAVTRTGKSPLVYAVLNRKCPERMVAECSRMGFSSHQPSVTGPQRSLLEDIMESVYSMWRYTPKYFDCRYMQQHSAITSPLVCAVLRDSAVLVHMLYESASCSRIEVVTLYTRLPRLTDVTTLEGERLHEEVQRMMQRRPNRADVLRQHYRRLTRAIKRHTALLRELGSTPRTLRSSCRLRILQHFPFSNKKRLQLLGDPQLLDGLPLAAPVKDYLQFSDLRDPDYGKKMGLPPEDTLEVVPPDENDEASEESTEEEDINSDEGLLNRTLINDIYSLRPSLSEESDDEEE